jgi:hypothetical protein
MGLELFRPSNISRYTASEMIRVCINVFIKRKLYRTNAAIWYNKTCRQKHLTPTYVNIRTKGKNPQNQKTLRTANQYRINQEIKFLYTKKTKLNEQLYKLHLTSSWTFLLTLNPDARNHEFKKKKFSFLFLCLSKRGCSSIRHVC